MKKIILTAAIALTGLVANATRSYAGTCTDVYIGALSASWNCRNSTATCFTHSGNTVILYTCKAGAPISPYYEPVLIDTNGDITKFEAIKQ